MILYYDNVIINYCGTYDNAARNHSYHTIRQIPCYLVFWVPDTKVQKVLGDTEGDLSHTYIYEIYQQLHTTPTPFCLISTVIFYSSCQLHIGFAAKLTQCFGRCVHRTICIKCSTHSANCDPQFPGPECVLPLSTAPLTIYIQRLALAHEARRGGLSYVPIIRCARMEIDNF